MLSNFSFQAVSWHVENYWSVTESVSIKKKENINAESNLDLELGRFVSLSDTSYSVEVLSRVTLVKQSWLLLLLLLLLSLSLTTTLPHRPPPNSEKKLSKYINNDVRYDLLQS